MGQGTESSEACADRPTEVSVIKFVSKNHTIEEIAPKKEVYICKERGCGKIFTSQEEYKNHQVFENLKVKFICREPGCGKEMPDPGRMWWHYQECHNNDTNLFVCPYTKCGSVHTTSENLEDHIESSHRQLPRVPTEPEIICFEGTDSVMENVSRVNKEATADCGIITVNDYTSRNDIVDVKQSVYNINEENRIPSTKSQKSNEEYPKEQSKLRAALSSGSDYPKSETINRGITTRFPKNKDLLITKENFLIKYEARSPICNSENVKVESSRDGNTIFINSDVSLTKTTDQEHRMDLGNLEKVFRSSFERDSVKSDHNESVINCSDDEEYTPKKQRISRSKLEPYKCEINGCGKTYKNKTNFRHHQDSHKLISSVMNANATKTQKQKIDKATTISFFICKWCGVQISNVTALCKHYQETHANTKPSTSITKSMEIYRCKVTGCEVDFATSTLLSKQLNEVHTNNYISNTNVNTKTGNGSGILVERMFHDDTTVQQGNFKTDLKDKLLLNSLNVFSNSKDKSNSLPINKQESGD